MLFGFAACIEKASDILKKQGFRQVIPEESSVLLIAEFLSFVAEARGREACASVVGQFEKEIRNVLGDTEKFVVSIASLGATKDATCLYLIGGVVRNNGYNPGCEDLPSFTGLIEFISENQNTSPKSKLSLLRPLSLNDYRRRFSFGQHGLH